MGEDVEQWKLSYATGRRENWPSKFGKPEVSMKVSIQYQEGQNRATVGVAMRRVIPWEKRLVVPSRGCTGVLQG